MPAKIQLHHGDCLDIMPTLDAGTIDMVLADPPYGTTACKWDSIIPLEPLWENLKRLSKRNAAIVMTASQPFTSVLGVSNVRQLKYQWVWRKSRATGHLNAKKRPMKNCEDVLVFYRQQPVYNPQSLVDCSLIVSNSASHIARGISTGPSSVVTGGIIDKKYRQTKTGYPRQILDFASAGKTVHPTQKPVALMEYFIRTYTNEGDTVLDFAMGSGTTGVACKNLGRSFIGIEKDAEYFEIAQSRIDEA